MKKLTKILLLALTFTPFIYTPSVFFPDSTGKIFFVRFVVLIASALFIINFFYVKNFRDEIMTKIRIFIRHPLVLSIFAFITAFAISTVVAVDKYAALWGDVQRGEGFVGVLFLFSLFIFSLLVFERKDWLWFLKLSLLVSLFLIGKEFLDFFSGIERPGSFIGNPTFLAGYLLFTIFSSVLVFREAENKFWKYFSIATLVLSFLGIFITETRGAILGLALGGISVLIYGAFKGNTFAYKNLNFQKISIGLLCIIAVFSVIFFTTKNNEFWQKIPGLARVASISGDDISTRTRLFGIKSSLESINPASNGFKKLLLGWGPNNYILAFGKYYNQEQYKYEIEWFDRAHNKLLDVLVASGLIGLLAYLSIWFLYFRYILRKRDFSLETVGFVFFGIAFFVHLLFVFDHISTSVPFFIILAFVVHSSTSSLTSKELQTVSKPGQGKELFVGVLFAALTLCMCYVFIKSDFTAYFQMKKYLSFKRGVNSEIVISHTDSMFEPLTIAQGMIRRDFLTEYFKGRDISDKNRDNLLDIAFVKAEEYIEKMPLDFRFIASVAGAYARNGNEMSNQIFLKKSEEYWQKALAFIPNRPDFNFGLALNLAYQKRYDESLKLLDETIKADSGLADSYYYYGFVLGVQGESNYNKSLDYFEKSFEIKPSFFSENNENAGSIYSNFIKYFYNRRDKERFFQAANRLIENDHKEKDVLSKVLQYMQKENIWPKVEFK